jgi:SAM-dependent methyltransferase
MTGTKQITDGGSAHSGTAPELQDFHEQIFADDAQGGLYGAAENWLPIKRTGHFRRMDVLSQADIGDISNSVVGDFGTGPWGVACVFPKLRAARRCYGFDVSRKALEMAAVVDADIAAKTSYLTSDGETIPLDTDTLDILWAGEVIEHVREPQLFLQEVARVCRDHGQIFLSTPNKDAVYYLARGETYATGPEHIALMNYATLRQHLELFFTDIQISGYETSLYPDLDETITNEAALDLIQCRAFVCPEAASGFIVSARVNKALYERNRRNYELQEILWSGPSEHGFTSPQPMRLFGDVQGGSLEALEPLCFTVACSRLILLFWAHDWSGHARVNVDGEQTDLDLFSPGGGFHRFEVPLGPQDVHLVTIMRIGTRNPRSADTQVIFYKAICYTVAHP